jgi:hypothetical protein
VIFQIAHRAIDSTEWAATTPTPPAKMEAAIAALERGHFVALRNISLEGYDKTTRRTTCAAEAHFVLSDLDKVDARRHALANIAFDGLSPPADLYGSDPLDRVTFTVQPTPDGKDTLVETASSIETTSAIFEVAAGRVLKPSTSPAQQQP